MSPAFEEAEMEKKKPSKLFSWRQHVLIGVATCGGLALYIYRSYSRKGYIGKIDIGAMVFTTLLCIGIYWGMAWWGNRPEKED